MTRYQGNEQVTPSEVMAASFFDFMGALPIIMLMFFMIVMMKALQPEVIREIRLGAERIPAAFGRGATGE